MKNAKIVYQVDGNDLRKVVADALGAEKAAVTSEKETVYVMGIRGIRELFGVCHTTAQKYKNSFLKEAVIQRGRKLLIDKEKALRLFNERR